MEIKKLTEDDVSYIYNTSMIQEFPPEELKPLHRIHSLMQEGDYECIGLYLDNQIGGYGFFQKTDETDYILLDYLAVIEEYRNLGLGSKFLNLLLHYYKDYKGIVVEAEDISGDVSVEENQIRKRRFEFYRRIGFQELKIKCCIFGVSFKMFVHHTQGLNVGQLEQEVAHAEAAFYRRHLPKHIFRREVMIQLVKETQNG